jgi:hypothetical protein
LTDENTSGGQTLPHDHTDQPEQGGKLDFDNVTESSNLTNGDMTYANASGVMQRITNSNVVGDVLTNNGSGVPEFATPTPSTQSWTRIADQQQTGGSSTFTISSLSSTGKFLEFKACLGSGGSDSQRLRFGIGGTVDTGNHYSYEITTNSSAVQTNSGVSYINLVNGNSSADVFLSGSMSLDAAYSGTGVGVRRGTILVRRSAEQSFVTFQWDDDSTPLTDIQFFNWSGNDITGDISVWASQ